MSAALDLLRIVRATGEITPAQMRDPLLVTQSTLDEARGMADEVDQEGFDWLLKIRALRVVSRAEMAAEFTPTRFINRAARRAKARGRRR